MEMSEENKLEKKWTEWSVVGMGDGTLYPQGGSTRAQFAAMISRLALAG